MRPVLPRIRTFYGADPLHLLALIICFTLAGYAAYRLASTKHWPFVLAWFAGAVIGHDLVLFPLYALADRSLLRGLRSLRAGQGATRPAVPVVNHLRVPAAGSGLLLLLFFPMILRQSEQRYMAAGGRTEDPYLWRWLLVTGALFALSAITYAIRLGRARTRRDPPADHEHAIADKRHD
ncbi:hypothetical protein E1293_46300 [Actinomadura darangshiensis]|uniref:Uncharacterized protein n=1 Tax=Actinomadura darangshiensis TaxID=705336 RepID=A0A4V2YPV4_9ACTN|nr:hypothetical protein [Actinomadura darangshiensis]TDD59667.1 hypothetical protein E1293_46300 [Actinomadura darangshiensis]